jgi:hypothetical protein
VELVVNAKAAVPSWLGSTTVSFSNSDVFRFLEDDDMGCCCGFLLSCPLFRPEDFLGYCHLQCVSLYFDFMIVMWVENGVPGNVPTIVQCTDVKIY